MNTADTLKQAVLKAPLHNRLRVAERYAHNQPSESVFTWLELQDGALLLREPTLPALPLEPRFLSSVFERYGVPLEKWGDFTARISLPDGSHLLHMLFVPEFDVVPKDYLVWIPALDQYEEARVELCVLLVPPLLHLARAAARQSENP